MQIKCSDKGLLNKQRKAVVLILEEPMDTLTKYAEAFKPKVGGNVKLY